uniref:Uncharacterized protein n=1 Tax=Strigamia maritima TaxID=126957 RepID=T1JAB5_STRMM
MFWLKQDFQLSFNDKKKLETKGMMIEERLEPLICRRIDRRKEIRIQHRKKDNLARYRVTCKWNHSKDHEMGDGNCNLRCPVSIIKV